MSRQAVRPTGETHRHRAEPYFAALIADPSNDVRKRHRNACRRAVADITSA